MNGNIYIPKPCHENWNKMTPEEKGRHCAVCSKVVTDFTKMKTEEIISTLQTKDDVCGHIHIHQLTPTNRKQKVYFWIKGTLIPKIGYTAFAIFGLAAIFKKSAYAQTVDGGMHMIVNGGAKYQPQAKEQKQIHIEVVDESNQPVENASIAITSGNVTISNSNTNHAGSTSSLIEMQEVGYTFINLEVSAPGYRVKHIKDIRILKNGQTIKVKLDEEVILMGKMMIYEEPKIHTEMLDSNRKEEPVLLEQPVIELLTINEQVQVNPEQNDLMDVIDPTNTHPFSWNSMLDGKTNSMAFVSFPNPTGGDVTIETKQDLLFDVKVYNELGVLILQQTNQYKRSSLSLAGNATGTYFAILFIDNKAIETHKIILIK